MKKDEKEFNMRNLKKRADLVRLLFHKKDNFLFLSKRENEIMRMVHFEQLPLKEISEKMSLTETRVYQILEETEKRFRNNIFLALDNYDLYLSLYSNAQKKINHLEIENRLMKEILKRGIENRMSVQKEQIDIAELDFMKRDIRDAGFSTRTINAVRHGCWEGESKTVYDLFQIDMFRFKRARCIGIRVQKEVIEFFAAKGLDFERKKIVNINQKA